MKYLTFLFASVFLYGCTTSSVYDIEKSYDRNPQVGRARLIAYSEDANESVSSRLSAMVTLAQKEYRRSPQAALEVLDTHVFNKQWQIKDKHDRAMLAYLLYGKASILHKDMADFDRAEAAYRVLAEDVHNYYCAGDFGLLWLAIDRDNPAALFNELDAFKARVEDRAAMRLWRGCTAGQLNDWVGKGKVSNSYEFVHSIKDYIRTNASDQRKIRGQMLGSAAGVEALHFLFGQALVLRMIDGELWSRSKEEEEEIFNVLQADIVPHLPASQRGDALARIRATRKTYLASLEEVKKSKLEKVARLAAQTDQSSSASQVSRSGSDQRKEDSFGDVLGLLSGAVSSYSAAKAIGHNNTQAAGAALSTAGMQVLRKDVTASGDTMGMLALDAMQAVQKKQAVMPVPLTERRAASVTPGSANGGTDVRKYYAPLHDPSCVEYSVEKPGSLYAQLTNNCSVPVAFHWCWLPQGASGCRPDSTSNILEPGDSTKIHGPSVNQQTQAKYIVCNMSGENRAKTCNMKSYVPQ